MDMVLSVASSKGGVAKTMTSVALAGEAASRGRRTLLIDLDNQANATTQLLGRGAKTDEGRGWYRTVLDGDPVDPVAAVNVDNLWIVPAGDRTESLYDELRRMASLPPAQIRDVLIEQRTELAKALNDFDVVVMDSPATKQLGSLRDWIFAVSTHTLFPTKLDMFSTEGIENALKSLVDLDSREVPVADPVGLLLVAVKKASTQMSRSAMNELSTWSDAVPLFSSPVHDYGAAVSGGVKEMRTPREFLQVAREAERQRLKDLRSGIKGGESWSVSAAAGLVADYEAVYDELISRVRESVPA